jgi:hypothetical protein
MSGNKFPTNQIFAEKLFLHVLKDLWDIKDGKYLYQRLNAGRLLRQLLIDGDVLAQVANRRTRIPILFVVYGWGEAPDNLQRIPDGMKKYLKHNAEIAPEGQYLLPLKLEDYLAHSIGNFAGADITPRKLIKYVANNYGGVHLGSGKEDVTAYNKMDHLVQSNGEGAVFALLANVTQTVLSGLLPLNDSIVEQFEKNGETSTFTEEIKVADIHVENSNSGIRKGTINFWLKSDVHPEWYADTNERVFPPMINGDIRIDVSKNSSRELLIKTQGILGKEFNFNSPPIPLKSTSPDHGVNVHLCWDTDQLQLFIQGEEVGLHPLL